MRTSKKTSKMLYNNLKDLLLVARRESVEFYDLYPLSFIVDNIEYVAKWGFKNEKNHRRPTFKEFKKMYNLEVIMKNGVLLKKKPYTITKNGSKFESFRIVIANNCGFKNGQKFYQVKRSDGVLELIPEEIFKEDAFTE